MNFAIIFSVVLGIVLLGVSFWIISETLGKKLFKRKLDEAERVGREREEQLQARLQRQEKTYNDILAKHKEAGEAQIDNYLEQYREFNSQKLEQELQALKMNFDKQSASFIEKEQEMNNKLQDLQQQYESSVSALKRVYLAEHEKEKYCIVLSESDKDDVSYLLMKVATVIHHPEILNKIIWQEYYQKATNAMLDSILPNKNHDCAGIYKITSLIDKRCYIGRSVSVRSRLQEHIKSSLGVGTIADQKIHDEMRENGIWNYSFELLEECDKTILAAREKYYIALFQGQEYGFNQNAGG